MVVPSASTRYQAYYGHLERLFYSQRSSDKDVEESAVLLFLVCE